MRMWETLEDDFRDIGVLNLAFGGSTYAANTTLTAGLTNNSIYWDGAMQVTNQGTMWELQPVEVRARTVPVAS